MCMTCTHEAFSLAIMFPGCAPDRASCTSGWVGVQATTCHARYSPNVHIGVE